LFSLHSIYIQNQKNTHLNHKTNKVKFEGEAIIDSSVNYKSHPFQTPPRPLSSIFQSRFQTPPRSLTNNKSQRMKPNIRANNNNNNPVRSLSSMFNENENMDPAQIISPSQS
jgi:hypothetical protein